MTSALISLSLLGAAGCSGEGLPGDTGDEEIGSAVEAVSSLPTVTVYDSGSTDTVTDCTYVGGAYQCFHVGRFWVDLSVENLAYSKSVGVVWTDDGWKTQHTTYAGYKGGLGGNREKWGLEATFYGGYAPSYGRTVEYAVFATQNGKTAWDPLNNHFIARGELDIHDPIQVLETGFTYDAARGGTVMTGTVRVVNLAYDKQITVRLTNDGWQTTRDVDAVWSSGNDFKFTVTNLGTVPDHVSYAIRYRVAGLELWDNNSGQNYNFDVAPRFSESAYGALASGATGLSGNYSTSAWVSGLLPIEEMTCKLDGVPLPTCGTYTYGAYGGVNAYLSTYPLVDGAHQLSFSARVSGSAYQASYTMPFSVHNRVAIAPTWQPRPEATPPAPVGLARDAQDRVYVLYADGSVTRHDAFGQAGTLLVAAPTTVYEPSNQHLALDAQGRIYTLLSEQGASTLRRYLADGTPDASFGGGAVALGAGLYCVSDFGLAGGNAYFTDNCNGQLAGVDEQGNALTGLAVDPYLYPYSLCGDGQDLWLFGPNMIRYQVGPGGLTQVSSVPVPNAPYDPQVTCAGGQLTVLGGGQLSSVAVDGTLSLLWDASNYVTYDLPGAIAFSASVTRLSSGSILAVHQGTTIDQFTPLP